MVFNYIKIAFRSLLKNKGYSFLNIFGLAIGITCASLIFLWVEDEMSFNNAFEKQDQVYIIPTNQSYEGEWRTFYSTPGPLAQAMKDEIPGIVRATRSSSEERMFTVGENVINRRGRYADADFLEIFSLTFIEGNAKDAFSNPEAIVLTRKTAEDLYGKNVKVLGKVLRVNNTDNYLITGVVENLLENVSFPFSWVAPFERYRDGAEWMTEYGSFFSDTFVELSPEADFDTVDAQVRQILQEKTEESDTYAFLHTIKDWHLRSKFEGGEKVGGRITYVRLFSIIALIILLIACINFMNLSTARSEKRANEVGVRKAMGSGRSRLIIQFVSEALILSFIATLFSVFLLLILLPQFNLLIEKDLILGLSNPIHVLVLLGITLICGVFAGLYPAFYLSSFKPVEVLKGVKATHGSATFIRKGLVVGQFTISIVFIISTILVYQQIQHVKNRDLGYDKDQLISMNVNGTMIEKFSVIRQDLINTGVVKDATLSNSQLLQGGNNGSGLEWTGGTNTEDVLISFRYVSSDFLNTTGMELVEGRGFNKNVDADSTNVMITESFAKLMGEGSAIGKQVTRGDTYTVVGVVKDYLYGDMYGASDPVLFFNYHNYARYFYIKTNSDIAAGEMLSEVEAVLKKHNPAFPFEYTFVDERFNAKFKSEQLVGHLSQIFALLAIFISCLGLFGLAAYTAEQRSKEIGIRKVLGASVSTIIKLLSKDFLKLVFISILIAVPIAWLTMSNWLQDYAYRIEVNWLIFVIAGIMATLIALITVSFQAIKAALANPVDSLKTE
ncbi:ABC transporter permease [Flavobacteriaceae bacterium S0825]|uniref:ABC transporter permease n=1 Tax=Gaetbulibacter sp. S0825 TaxID=2720084 RepID=UPI00142F67F6|nr:ABC transporter permease [Gaetbulibacter sp. S0825]MCK0109990.1 ABC transporter permease [Flavobacteriaceae bacterium S0825]NIX65619.1 FtsX-like permease family protein [Gaetbulibacter sp. S0825]